MRPARHFRDRARPGTGDVIERFKTGVAIPLKKSGKRRQVRGRVLTASIGAIKISGSWAVPRCRKAGRRAHRPRASRSSSARVLAPAQDRRVVAVDLLGREDMAVDRRDDGSSSQAACPTQSHKVERSRSTPLSGVDLALPIERQVVAILRHSRCASMLGVARPRGSRHRRCEGLGDGIAGRAGVLRPHVADHLEPTWHVVQHLGYVHAEPRHAGPAVGAGTGTVILRLVHDLLPGQMIGERLPFGLRPFPLNERPLIASALTASSASPVSSSSSRSSSCAISRAIRSDDRPNCMRRSFAIWNLSFSISNEVNWTAALARLQL